MSDLHNEEADKLAEFVRPDGVDLLVIAGDYHEADKIIPSVRQQFADIPLVMIAGNHEHMHNKNSVEHDIELLREAALKDRQDFNRQTYFLENDTIVLTFNQQQVRFIGATLWTDFDLFGQADAAMIHAKTNLVDFLTIKRQADPREVIRPSDLVEYFHESRQYIGAKLRERFAGPTVVVTHFLPSLRSVAERNKSHPLTPSFASACDDLLELGADLWIHGHTHALCDYMAGETRVVCNPMGFLTQDIDCSNQSFNPGLVVDV